MHHSQAKNITNSQKVPLFDLSDTPSVSGMEAGISNATPSFSYFSDWSYVGSGTVLLDPVRGGARLPNWW